MKICAISDIHGTLPDNIGECDVLFICGDIFPLEIQRYNYLCKEWLNTSFADWVEGLPCKHVYFIAGNHDFYFQRQTAVKTKELINSNEKLRDKATYVEDELIEIGEGLTVFGNPWCTGPQGWAFVDTVGSHYENIPDCDILLTHQPPRVEKLGCSYPNKAWERNFGSATLLDAIMNKNIRYNFCGHIHSGVHGGVKIDGVITQFYNVSIKDEDYEYTYEPFYIEISGKDGGRDNTENISNTQEIH